VAVRGGGGLIVAPVILLGSSRLGNESQSKRGRKKKECGGLFARQEAPETISVAGGRKLVRNWPGTQNHSTENFGVAFLNESKTTGIRCRGRKETTSMFQNKCSIYTCPGENLSTTKIVLGCEA